MKWSSKVMSSTKQILTNSSVEHTNICQKSSMNVHPLVCSRTVLNQTSGRTFVLDFSFRFVCDKAYGVTSELYLSPHVLTRLSIMKMVSKCHKQWNDYFCLVHGTMCWIHQIKLCMNDQEFNHSQNWAIAHVHKK